MCSQIFLFFFFNLLFLPLGDYSTKRSIVTPLTQNICHLPEAMAQFRHRMQEALLFPPCLISNACFMQATSYPLLPQPRFDGLSKIRLWEIRVAAGHILLFLWQGTDNWRSHFVYAPGSYLSAGKFLFMWGFWKHILNLFPTFLLWWISRWWIPCSGVHLHCWIKKEGSFIVKLTVGIWC